LHRYRAKNQLLEIRAAELRFKVEETEAFIAQDSALKQNLSPEDIRLLTYRTDGWAVGLQLAILWLKGQQNSSTALKDFSGNNRFVLEYLGEEVLAKQPEAVRTFLLKTSILDRFNLSLANTLTGLEWSIEELAKLEQANLFLIPLDSEGEWFSYHHLFQEFLQHLLKKEYPQIIGELYSRASRWFAETNLIYEAIQYGLVARDYEQIITLINSFGLILLNRSRYRILERWLDQIPRPKIYEYPELALFYAWVCLYNDSYCDDEKALLAAESGFQANGNEQKLGELFVIRAFSANYQNDLDATIQYANQALKFLSKENVLMLGGLTLALGRAYLNNGEVIQSLEVITQSRHYNQQAGYLSGQSMCDREFGNIAILQGNLSAGLNYYLKILETLKERPEEPITVYLDLATVYLELNNLDRALEFAQLAEEYSSKSNAFYFLASAILIQARISLAGQQIEQSLNFLQKAVARLPEKPSKKLQVQIEAFKIELWLHMGEDKLLSDWYEAIRITGYSDLTKALPFFREPEAFAIVRVLIYRQQFSEALTRLTVLEQEAKKQGRVNSLIKIYVLKALAAQPLNPELVTTSLDLALELAHPGGYIRTFVDEGKNMETLLKTRAVTNSNLTKYIDTILKTFQLENQSTASLKPTSLTTTPSVNYDTLQSELLTERELEVLLLVASGASNREIGDQMVITLPTVKKHLSNIFGKLRVTSRTQALIRAKELGLL
jgi:LuxR family maltose regulon positive regulatory protein